MRRSQFRFSSHFCFVFVSGTSYLLMQIALADLISLAQIKLELFYIYHRSWLEWPEFCPIYLGLDAFTNSAIIFFIVAINLHTISTFNLAQKTIAKKELNLLTNEDCEAIATDNTNDANASIDQSLCGQRSIVIDYSKPKSQISVILPIVFIWFLAASISIPLFWQGSVLPTKENPKFCGIVQFHRSNSLIMKILLIKMRIVVPTVCLLLSTIYVILKLLKVKQTIRPCGLDEDVQQILKLALALSISFILFSFQRSFGSLWFELISRPMMEYKYALFDTWIGLAGCMLHYVAPIIRPFIYIRYEKNLSNDIRLFCCRKRK